MTIAVHARPDQRIFVGVTDPINPVVETAVQVRDRVLLAAEYIAPERLGTCDDCGFAPFSDDLRHRLGKGPRPYRGALHEPPSNEEREVMAHIDLGVDEVEFPGITGPMLFRPETAKPLNELAEVLLRGPHSLAPGNGS